MRGPTLLTNITISAPVGSRFEPNPPGVCTPASWSDILLFFAANYLAHLATVRVDAGSTFLRSFKTYISCFFFPLNGLQNALNCILHCSMAAPDEVQKAVRAGALCIVVEGKRPDSILPRRRNTKSVGNWWSRLWSAMFYQRKLDIPENFVLPENYCFVEAPRNAYIDITAPCLLQHRVKYRWDWFKIMISTLQSAYSSWSIYRVTLYQLDRFGYASFGLTVAPYAIMGFLNLLANLITPEFDEMALLDSSGLQLALRGTKFSIENIAVVGRLVETTVDHVEPQYGSTTDMTSMLHQTQKFMTYLKAPHPITQWFYATFSWNTTKLRYNELNSQNGKNRFLLLDALNSPNSKKRNWLLAILSAASVAGVYGVIYVISRADPKQSSLGQRIWTMGWLLCGTGVPIVIRILQLGYFTFMVGLFKKKRAQGSADQSVFMGLLFLLSFVVIGGALVAFPVGGIITVAQMIFAFGSCTVLT